MSICLINSDAKFDHYIKVVSRLISRVNLASLWCLVVWKNTSLAIAVKIFFRFDNTDNQSRL